MSGRCAVGVSRIEGHGVTAKVLEYPLDHGRCLDARDNTQAPTALTAALDVDGEHTPQALCPGHCRLAPATFFLPVPDICGGR